MFKPHPRPLPRGRLRAAAAPGYLTLALFALAFVLGSYFAFAAVQGDHGVFRRAQIVDEIATLRAERDRLAAELDRMTNLTRRLSDDWMDLDLLDERARDVLGLMRADEVAIH